MNAKQYLSRIEKLDVLINNKLEQCERIREQATSLGLDTEKDRVQTSYTGGIVENAAIKLVDLTRSIESDVNKFLKLKQEAMQIIDSLEDAKEINLLYKRYIHFEPWEQIFKEMNYSEQTVYRMHGYALQKVQKILNLRVNESK